MLQILATYREVPEQTAMKMLANDLLLDRLRTEHDDTKFAEQVEAAFVEENRNLLEEKAAIEQELKRQKARAEEESRKRQEDRAAFENKSKELNNAIEEAGRQLDAASRAVAEHEKAANDASERAQKAEEVAGEVRRKAKLDADTKLKAERNAFRMSVVAGAAIGIGAVIVFVVLAHALPWTWLVSHKNSVPLQIGISATFVCASMGAFVRAWRSWCWGVGVLTFAVTLLSLMGN
jgi:hypothetical protein